MLLAPPKSCPALLCALNPPNLPTAPAGVTRDRIYTRAFWGDKDFTIIDTGGLMSEAAKLDPVVMRAAMDAIGGDGLPAQIERQAAAGVAEADAVLLVTDGQAGLHTGGPCPALPCLPCGAGAGWLRRW